MVKRLALLAVAAIVATLVLLASQYRQPPPKISGFIEADEIRLGSRVGGRVAEVHVEEGDVVERGRVLVELEPFDWQERRAEAAAQVAAREAEYLKLKQGYRAEEIAQAEQRHERLMADYQRLKNGPRTQEIDAARALVKVAEAQLALAQQTFKRTSDLFSRNSVSQETMDQAEEALRVAENMQIVRTQELNLLVEGTRKEDLQAAEAQRREAEASWNLMKNGYRQEDIDLAQAAMDAAKAGLQAIEQQLRELVIVAPLAGVIESVDLQPGDLAPAGVPAMSMLDTSRLWVRAYLPENASLQLQQQVTVTVDAYPDQEFTGEVVFVSRQAEFTPSNVQTPEERSKQVFRIKVMLREGLDLLRPGMSADVWLPAGKDKP